MKKALKTALAKLQGRFSSAAIERIVRRRRRGEALLRLEALERRTLLSAGPYAPAAGQPGSTAIYKDDPAFAAWATGWENYVIGEGVTTTWQTPGKALGKAVGDSYDIVTLGRGGEITLTFDKPIVDGPGWDFAAFENGFSDTFLELGYVEVSSDGANFFRFPNDSLTSSPVSAFGAVDPMNITGYVSKYRQGYGTPFDLAELAGVDPLLDVNNVTHVKIVDITGDGTFLDSDGDPIYDPYPTASSAGVDLDAIGVIHYGPTTLDFEDVGASLPAESYWNGPDPDADPEPGPYGDTVVFGDFESGGLRFPNAYSETYGSWTGWAYSNTTDTTTAGYTNQFSAYTGGGADGSPTYAVAYRDVLDLYASPTIERTFATEGLYFESVTVTNTTYAVLSMLQGDSFAKKFGGTTGDDPDWMLLTIEGKDADGASLGTVEFYLADYRFADNSQDYIVDQWTEIDVSSIGAAETLEFVVTSSDVDPLWGMNTPAYLALDDVVLGQGPPTLTLDVASDSVSEAGGTAVTTATLTRHNGDISAALTVTLSNDDAGEVAAPVSVEIPANQSSIEFDIDAADDLVVDGTQTVTLVASADGYVDGSDSLEVTDDDVPTLTLTVSPESVSETDAPPTTMFEDVGETLEPESYWNGSDESGGFESDGLVFNNDYNASWGSWAGWSYSNTTDTTTAGYLNQYSAYTGRGDTDSPTYGVGNAYPGGFVPTIELTSATEGKSFASLMVTNTTYAALSMLEGDAFARQFGGPTGDDPDWFLLTIEGIDGSGGSIGTVDFYLADYRFADNSEDYIVDEWTEVDLSSLSEATRLEFSLSSSDAGDYGMNTPAYFAVDNILLSDGEKAAAIGTVYRNDEDMSNPLVVSLSCDDLSEARVPATVTIPAGQSSVEFDINAVDDVLPDGTQTATVTASAAGYLGGVATLDVTDDETAEASGWRYDFGTADSAVAVGYTRVTAATTYTMAAGFGWQSGTIFDRDREVGTDRDRDFSQTRDGVFLVDIANGSYLVAVSMWDGWTTHDEMELSLEGEVVDTVSTGPPQPVLRTYRVNVTDGQLAVGVRNAGGIDPFAVINALEIAEAPVPPTEACFDFGTADSPVEPGYTPVTSASLYTMAAGYGWQSGTIFDRDRGLGTDRDRDFNQTRDGVFLVDLPNGSYLVTVNMWDAWTTHDEMELSLEGEVVDTLVTGPPQPVLRTYRVDVTDGQLTVGVRNAGGIDPFAVINALAIEPVASGGGSSMATNSVPATPTVFAGQQLSLDSAALDYVAKEYSRRSRWGESPFGPIGPATHDVLREAFFDAPNPMGKAPRDWPRLSDEALAHGDLPWLEF